MKLLLTYLIIGFLAVSPSKEEKETFTISGTITSSRSYCGGVPPTDEMLKRIQASRPVSGFTIYVIKGTENKLSSAIIDSVDSDSNGTYSFNLPPGDYILLQKNQIDTEVFDRYASSRWIQVNKDCMEKWWKKGLTTITVGGKDINNLDFHFQKRCFIPENIPCLRYTGPYPP